MPSPEAKQAVATELKRIVGTLELFDDQQGKLRTALENAREMLDQTRESNPNFTEPDLIAKLNSVRNTARERLVQFLTPEQLDRMGR